MDQVVGRASVTSTCGCRGTDEAMQIILCMRMLVEQGARIDDLRREVEALRLDLDTSFSVKDKGAKA